MAHALDTRGRDAFGRDIEEAVVAAEVEDAEVGLVLAGAEEVRAQACTAAHHLPELGLGVHGLEEDQVHHLGDVDARIQHVHAHGDLGQQLGVAELVDEVLGVLLLIVDHRQEVPGIVRELLLEALADGERMQVVAGEDDGLAQLVAALHLDAVRHHMRQGLVDGVGVEEPVVDGLRADLVRHRTVGVAEGLLVVPLVALVQVGVLDAPCHEAEVHLLPQGWYQEAVLHGLFQLIVVRGVVLLAVEQRVGVAVAFGAWCGGEAQQQAVEIVEDGLVALVHAAVGFIHDHQIEVPHAEGLQVVRAALVDAVEQRGVGAEHDAGALVIPAAGQVQCGHVGQVLLKRPLRLGDQGVAVGQEQHPLHPVAFHQQVHQCGGSAGLAAAGGHHHQGATASCPQVAVVLCHPRLGHAADGLVLVIAPGDPCIHRQLADVRPAAAPVHQQLQFIARVEALHRSRCGEGVVPAPGVEAVGVVDHRALAVHALQAVRIEARLHAAVLLAHQRALGLHHGQGLAISAPQHIVREAVALRIGAQRHAGHGVLRHVGGIGVPACFAQQLIDEEPPCFRFAVGRLGQGQGSLALLAGLHLGQQGLQGLFLALQLQALTLFLLVALALGLVAFLQLLQFGDVRHLLRLHRRCQQRFIEHAHLKFPDAVGAGEPLQVAEQKPHAGHALALHHFLVVRGRIARAADVLEVGVDARRHQLAESGGIHQHAQLPVVGPAQVAVVVVEPMNALLQCAAGMHRRGDGRRKGETLRLHGLLRQGRPLFSEEAEVAHRSRSTDSSRGSKVKGSMETMRTRSARVRGLSR